jgi:hypothetical protein
MSVLGGKFFPCIGSQKKKQAVAGSATNLSCFETTPPCSEEIIKEPLGIMWHERKGDFGVRSVALKKSVCYCVRFLGTAP